MNKKDSLNIGHDSIDQHHQEIFKLTNKLEEAIKKQDKAILNDVICFLETHTLNHFKEEEDLMKSHQFYDYEDHNKEHLIFIKKINHLREIFLSNCPLPLSIYYVRRFTDQLIHHVITVDMKLKDISITSQKTNQQNSKLNPIKQKSNE